MKTLTVLILSLLASSSYAQSSKKLLTQEQAYRSYRFNVLEHLAGKDALNDVGYGRQPYSDDEGFIYLNLADSLVVLHCSSVNEFKISECMHVKQIWQPDPIVARGTMTTRMMLF